MGLQYFLFGESGLKAFLSKCISWNLVPDFPKICKMFSCRISISCNLWFLATLRAEATFSL